MNYEFILWSKSHSPPLTLEARAAKDYYIWHYAICIMHECLQCLSTPMSTLHTSLHGLKYHNFVRSLFRITHVFCNLSFVDLVHHKPHLSHIVSPRGVFLIKTNFYANFYIWKIYRSCYFQLMVGKIELACTSANTYLPKRNVLQLNASWRYLKRLRVRFYKQQIVPRYCRCLMPLLQKDPFCACTI